MICYPKRAIPQATSSQAHGEAHGFSPSSDLAALKEFIARWAEYYTNVIAPGRVPAEIERALFQAFFDGARILGGLLCSDEFSTELKETLLFFLTTVDKRFFSKLETVALNEEFTAQYARSAEFEIEEFPANQAENA